MPSSETRFRGTRATHATQSKNGTMNWLRCCCRSYCFTYTASTFELQAKRLTRTYVALGFSVVYFGVDPWTPCNWNLLRHRNGDDSRHFRTRVCKINDVIIPTIHARLHSSSIPICGRMEHACFRFPICLPQVQLWAQPFAPLDSRGTQNSTTSSSLEGVLTCSCRKSIQVGISTKRLQRRVRHRIARKEHGSIEISQLVFQPGF
jgi:hypothetical protein